MHSNKLVFFLGQIETALQKFRANLELRVKKLFAVLHVKSHLTGAGICKQEGCPPINLLFVLTNLGFVHIKTVHDLLDRPLKSLVQAQKDAFYSIALRRPNGVGGLFTGAFSPIWGGSCNGPKPHRTTA